MFNLRMTWNEVFPQTKLYALDVKVNVMDNNWPITAKIVPKSVHVNPNFLKGQPADNQAQTRAKEDLLNQMQAKERELLELKQRKIELELMVTRKKIAESEKEICGGSIVSEPAGCQVFPPANLTNFQNLPNASKPSGAVPSSIVSVSPPNVPLRNQISNFSCFKDSADPAPSRTRTSSHRTRQPDDDRFGSLSRSTTCEDANARYNCTSRQSTHAASNANAGHQSLADVDANKVDAEDSKV